MPVGVAVVDPEDPGFALDPTIAKLNVYYRHYDKDNSYVLKYTDLAADGIECGDDTFFTSMDSQEKIALGQ